MDHQESEKDSAKPISDSNFSSGSGDLSFAAYIIGAAVLVGAILVTISMFVNTNRILQHIDSGSGVAAGTQTAPAAPSAAGTQPSTAPTGPVNITLKPNTPFLGSGSAKVTVVEYADYQCPFCERWYTSTWPDLKAKYVDTGKIKFVYQDFAFLGPDSNTLAEGSHCAADQNKFWQYHDYIFSHQQQENTGWATQDKVEALAQNISGLNSSQFNQCLNSGKYKQEVLDETAAGRQYGVTGTPTVFVNGTAIVGAQPATAFEQAIDAALK